MIARDPGPGRHRRTAAGERELERPPDWGLATQTLQARSRVQPYRFDAGPQEHVFAGFDELGSTKRKEARTWDGGRWASTFAPLTAQEATQAHRVRRASSRRSKTRRSARSPRRSSAAERSSTAKPIYERTSSSSRDGPPPVRAQHRHGRVSQTVELIGKAEEFIGEVEKWTGERGERARKLSSQAKKLEDIHRGQGDLDKVGEVKKVADLAKNIATLTGAIGKTPGGVDDIGAMEAALDVMDFAVSKIEVPGFKQLWDGYIFKAAKICLKQLRALKEQLYKGDREGGVRFFFEQNRGEQTAPSIKDAYFHGVDSVSSTSPAASRCSTSCGG